MTRHFYIHIPFCRQKCPYCKFALTPIFDDFKKKRYMEYLKKEIREYFLIQNPPNSLGQGRIKTIYFGGGTPSVLSHDEISDILECFPFYFPPIRRSQRGYPTQPPLQGEELEISFESNPEDITAAYVQGLFDLGINRLSIGVQSLNNETLKAVHRSDRDTIFRALECIGSAFLSSRRRRDPFQDHVGENNTKNLISRSGDDSFSQVLGIRDGTAISINIDFILGLPHSRSGETLAHIRELHDTFPWITHTSVYMLEDELYPPDWTGYQITEDEIQSEFREIMTYFEKISWHHYELSNWSKPGHECRHNQAYWDHSSYRGFGLSASSYDGRVRRVNSDSFQGYYRGEYSEDVLSDKDRAIEKLMFGLRSDQGYDLGSGLELDQKKQQQFVQDGHLVEKNGRLHLTKTGIFILDYIMGELL